jgi:hypothetical protein
LAISPKVWVEKEVLASIVGKRAMTPGRRKRSHGFE